MTGKQNTSSTNEIIKPSQEGICWGTATEELEEALLATAGGTARVFGMLCCSVVGNGFGDPSFEGGLSCAWLPFIS